MNAAFRKSPSVKQWAALDPFSGILHLVSAAALGYYRDCKSIEHAVDVLASDPPNPAAARLILGTTPGSD